MIKGLPESVQDSFTRRALIAFLQTSLSQESSDGGAMPELAIPEGEFRNKAFWSGCIGNAVSWRMGRQFAQAICAQSWFSELSEEARMFLQERLQYFTLQELLAEEECRRFCREMISASIPLILLGEFDLRRYYPAPAGRGASIIEAAIPDGLQFSFLRAAGKAAYNTTREFTTREEFFELRRGKGPVIRVYRIVPILSSPGTDSELAQEMLWERSQLGALGSIHNGARSLSPLDALKVRVRSMAKRGEPFSPLWSCDIAVILSRLIAFGVTPSDDRLLRIAALNLEWLSGNGIQVPGIAAENSSSWLKKGGWFWRNFRARPIRNWEAEFSSPAPGILHRELNACLD